MDNFFATNQRLLALSQPQLAPYWPQIASCSLQQTELLDLKNPHDHKGLAQHSLKVFNSDGSEYTLHSTYNPVREAQKIVDQCQLEDAALIVLMGLGMGFQCHEIVRRKAKQDVLCVVEKRIDVFCQFLRHNNLKRWPAMDHLFFFIGDDFIELFRLIRQNAITIAANPLKIIRHIPSLKANQDFYEQAIGAIAEAEKWSIVNINSLINKADVYAGNIFENMFFMLNNPGVLSFKNSAAKRPAFLVAAGPSLKKNMHLLHWAKRQGVVIAVDTSFQLLVNSGLIPHFVVSIDFTTHNLKYFQGMTVDQMQQTCLVVDPEAHPDIVKMHKGPHVFVNLPGKSLCDWFESQIGPWGMIPKGISVAHTAFHWASWLNCDPIIFLGQDLSYPDGMSHAWGTSMARKESYDVNEPDTMVVTDIFGGRVASSVSMSVFVQHFVEIIDEEHKIGRRCWDATEGGALIQGASPYSLFDALWQLDQEHKQNCQTPQKPWEWWDFRNQNEHHMQRITRADVQLTRVISRLNQFVKHVHTVLSLLEQALSLLGKSEAPWLSLQKWQQQLLLALRPLDSQRDLFTLMQDMIMEAIVIKSQKKMRQTFKELIEQRRRNELEDLLREHQQFFIIVQRSAKMSLQGFQGVQHNLPSSETMAAQQLQ